MSNVSKRRRDGTRPKIKTIGDHNEFLRRITKSLYYGRLPSLPCLSLPVTEISCELWSVSQKGRSLRRLHTDEAASIARSACVSPCALVLAILYLERLKSCNPEYLASTAPNDLFLVSLMVGNKFLQDDGEDDEVICSEWATSGNIDLKQLKTLEIEFLSAIDWKVFVSDDAFEAGLLWLERQVAMKQALLRGFFTYSDLTVSCDPALFSQLVKSASSACMTMTLSYITSLITVLTSSIVISQVWITVLQYVLITKVAVAPLNANITQANPTQLTPQHNTFSNTTLDVLELEESLPVSVSSLTCCTNWMKAHHAVDKVWYDEIVNDSKGDEPWWSLTVHNWLYQSSLVNPLQRWLEKASEVGDFINKELFGSNAHRSMRCNMLLNGETNSKQYLQTRNLNKFSGLFVSVSDR